MSDEAKSDSRGGETDSTSWWELLKKGMQYKGWAELLRPSLEINCHNGPEKGKGIMIADSYLSRCNIK